MTIKIVTVVLAIIRNNEGKYLMTLRVANDPEDRGYLGFWQIPGGGWQIGETMEQAVLREAREELGINVEIIQKIPKVFDSMRNDWRGQLNCYLCKMKNPDEKIVLNEEASEYKWFTFDEIKKLKSFPANNSIIQEAEKISSADERS